LLLAARKPSSRLLQAVLGLVPQAGLFQDGLDNLIQVRLARRQAVNPGAIGDVVVDRFRKGVRLLKDHADMGAQLHDIERLVAYVLAIHLDLADHAAAVNDIVHAVEATQKGRLSTARGADQCGDLVPADIQIDVLQGMRVAVVDIHVARAHFAGRGTVDPCRPSLPL